MYVLLCVLYVHECLWRLEQDIICPDGSVIGGFETPDMSVWEKTQVL